MNIAGINITGLKIAGAIIIAFGLVDLTGSFTGFDLWGEFIGLELPELLWKYSSLIEIAVGYFIMTLGSDDKGEAEVSA